MPANLVMNNSVFKNLTFCDTQSQNPYCGKFGVEEIVDIVFLSIFTVIGTFGNFLIIFLIIYDKGVHKQGNIFIINLATADLVVSNFCGVLLQNKYNSLYTE